VSGAEPADYAWISPLYRDLDDDDPDEWTEVVDWQVDRVDLVAAAANGVGVLLTKSEMEGSNMGARVGTVRRAVRKDVSPVTPCYDVAGKLMFVLDEDGNRIELLPSPVANDSSGPKSTRQSIDLRPADPNTVGTPAEGKTPADVTPTPAPDMSLKTDGVIEKEARALVRKGQARDLTEGLITARTVAEFRKFAAEDAAGLLGPGVLDLKRRQAAGRMQQAVARHRAWVGR